MCILLSTQRIGLKYNARCKQNLGDNRNRQTMCSSCWQCNQWGQLLIRNMQKITTTTSITIVTVTTTNNNHRYQYHQQWSRTCDCVVVLRLATTFLLYFQLTKQPITPGLKLMLWSLNHRGIDELWYEPMWLPSLVVFEKHDNQLSTLCARPQTDDICL